MSGERDTTDTLWYKDAVIYELHVRAFHDSNGDGVGDFCGLTAKLDYLQDLGVTAIWLLPFYPSPLRDDGYDIADYTGIHPAYGTMRDFKIFLKEAHRRGLKVITELVLNHTSDAHSWFQRARQAKLGSPWRDFYVWSDTPERYRDARIIFQDFESSNWTWDSVAQSYFWHRFYAHQPDLNYDNPRVRKAILKIVDFWLGLGVDGLRLDAVPYLFEREGTTGENLPHTHAALRRLRRHIDQGFESRMLLAEANQWPEDAVAYFGDGDECHMAFHFPLMPRLFMSLRMEDRFPIVDILDQTPPIPDNAQWALFLRNHDELTLEMVTEEERVFMYRSYARSTEARINLGIRRRLAPLLHNDRRRVELLNTLLCSLPGTPVFYYGDEIGMGDNVYLGDRNGVRTPMQWSGGRNAGFSEANPQQLFLPLIVDHEYHFETVHVEAQQQNPQSLLWWMKRLIALRKRYQAFSRGDMILLHPANRKALAFVRSYDGEHILVIANLSRFTQHVELDLNAYRGRVPVDMFGRSSFPTIGKQPYTLTLSPYICHWFALEAQPEAIGGGLAPGELPKVELVGDWAALGRGDRCATLEEVALPRYLRQAAWFDGKTRPILTTTIVESITVPCEGEPAHLLLVKVEYIDGEPQLYAMPLAYAAGRAAARVRKELPHALVADLARPGDDRPAGVIYDALWSEPFAAAMLQAIARRQRLKGLSGTVTVSPGAAYRLARQVERPAALSPQTLQAGHQNTSIAYADQLILKLFRCVDEGPHPEVTIGDFLTAKRFEATPAAVAALEYQPDSGGMPSALAALQAFVPNQGEAWEYVQELLARYFDSAAGQAAPEPIRLTTADLLDQAGQAPPEPPNEGMDRIELLGRRTAELHLALLGGPSEPDFAPLPFTPLYQRSLYQSLRGLVAQVAYRLGQAEGRMSEAERADARRLLELEPELLACFRSLVEHKIDALRTRCHGDYHLAQALYTGDNFVIFDFEGEASRPLPERTLKGSPVRDVAGMLQSLKLATFAARMARGEGKRGWDLVEALDPWARQWYTQAAAAFLRGYLAAIGDAGLVPAGRAELRTLLDVFLLERAIYGLRNDLAERGELVRIALQDVQDLLA
jgi:maltose alpha-D-glucosyltransferase/alpha-amylase